MFYEIFIWFGPFWNITWPATDHQISWVHNGLSGTQRTYWHLMIQDKIVRCNPGLAIMTGCSLIWLPGIHKQTDVSAPVVPSFFSPNLSSLFCPEPPFLFLTWLGAVFLDCCKLGVEFYTTLFAYFNQLGHPSLRCTSLRIAWVLPPAGCPKIIAFSWIVSPFSPLLPDRWNWKLIHEILFSSPAPRAFPEGSSWEITEFQLMIASILIKPVCLVQLSPFHIQVWYLISCFGHYWRTSVQD